MSFERVPAYRPLKLVEANSRACKGLHREAATMRKSDALLDMPEPVRPNAAFISVGRGLFPLFLAAGFSE